MKCIKVLWLTSGLLPDSAVALGERAMMGGWFAALSQALAGVGTYQVRSSFSCGWRKAHKY